MYWETGCNLPMLGADLNKGLYASEQVRASAVIQPTHAKGCATYFVCC